MVNLSGCNFPENKSFILFYNHWKNHGRKIFGRCFKTKVTHNEKGKNRDRNRNKDRHRPKPCLFLFLNNDFLSIGEKNKMKPFMYMLNTRRYYSVKEGNINKKKNESENESKNENEKEDTSIQSELVRTARRICRKDDLCRLYKFTDEFLNLLKNKKISQRDFCIIIHLLHKKKFEERSFWKEVTNTQYMDFVFSMNFKQIVLFFYSVVNSYKYINEQFVTLFTKNMLTILDLQLKFLILEKKKLYKIHNNFWDNPSRLSFRSPISENKISKKNQLVQENDIFKGEYENSKQHMENSIQKICNKKPNHWKDIINREEEIHVFFHYCKSLFEKENNQINFFDLTLLTNTYSKLKKREHMKNVENIIIKLTNVFYKIFLYFLFFKKIDWNHLCLFLHSYGKIKEHIGKHILKKIKTLLLSEQNSKLKQTTILEQNPLSEHTTILKQTELSEKIQLSKHNTLCYSNVFDLNIGSLNMLLYTLGKFQFYNEFFFRQIILSFVVQLNMKSKECERYDTVEPLGIEENNKKKHRTNEILEREKEKKRREKMCMIQYFCNNNTYYLEKKEHLKKIMRKDFSFLAYNINKMNIQNYFNIHEYIKEETKNRLNTFSVYDCSIFLHCLIDLNILEEDFFLTFYSYLKIIFDKNKFNEKDVKDIFLALCKYVHIMKKYKIEVQSFFQNIYSKIKKKIKKYNYINIISIFCSCSYVGVKFENELIQDLSIDILNNLHSLDIHFLIVFLYFLEGNIQYQKNPLFLNSLFSKMFLQIKDTETLFSLFHIYHTCSLDTLMTPQSLQIFTNTLKKTIDIKSFHWMWKQKIIMAIHLFCNPYLINKDSFIFLHNTFGQVLFSKNEKKKYINKQEKEQMEKKIKIKNNDSFQNKNNNHNIYYLFFKGHNSLINIIDPINHIKNEELESFIFLLSFLDFLQWNTSLPFLLPTYTLLLKNKSNREHYVKSLSNFQTKDTDTFFFLTLNSPIIKYFFKKENRNIDNVFFQNQEIEQKELYKSMKCDQINEITKERVSENLLEMDDRFCNFEQTLLNVLKMIYEDSILFYISQKKNENFEKWIHKNSRQFPNAFIYDKGNIYIKYQKNLFIYSFQIPYIFYLPKNVTI